METMLQERGFESGSPADVVIVNTCAVTAEAGRKSRQLIHRLRAENPGALIAVCGCYSQAQEAEGDIVYGTNDKKGFVDAIVKGTAARVKDDPFHRHEFEFLPAGAVDGRTRAMLKIQDGCVNFCSYCIIPYTRGRLRSLPVADAAAETARMAEEGFRELVITGIEIASYGVDLPGKPGLADVLEACAAAAGNMRLHLGSLEPRIIDREFCERISRFPNICRHFHLALQSGCDETLKAMNRKYDTARFYESCCLLREYFPGCSITCDMIVGFPGETEENFRETLVFIRKCSFAQMHIFPYSRRPGTPADKMPDQLTAKEKSCRASAASQVAGEMRREFLEAQIGRVLPVLMESGSQGHTDTYLLVKAEGAQKNTITDVRIESTDGECLYGTCI